MTRQGRLARWDAARGFGFIQSADSPADVFVHVRDVDSRLLPLAVGMALVFEEIHVGGKGPRAMAVRAPGQPAPARGNGAGGPADRRRPLASQAVARRRRAAEATGSQQAAKASMAGLAAVAILVVMEAALLGWAVLTNRLPSLALIVWPLWSFLTFFAYWRDKYAAEQDRWRTSERTLHLLSLTGGWPGALLAQRVLRHKTRKADFLFTYRLTVIGHLAMLGAWVGHR